MNITNQKYFILLAFLICSVNVFAKSDETQNLAVKKMSTEAKKLDQQKISKNSVGDLQRCLLNAIEKANNSATVGDLKTRCEQAVRVENGSVDSFVSDAQNSDDVVTQLSPVQSPSDIEDKTTAEGDAANDRKRDSAVRERIKGDKRNRYEPFSILAHRPNYILFAAYNDQNYNTAFLDAQENQSEERLDDIETQFQISIKTPLATNLFDQNIDLYGAYTVRSFWQAFNSEESALFRETNHEPEFWFQGYPDWELLGFKNSIIQVGFNHQSNGRNELISRSWNRIFANFIFDKNNIALGIKAWYRIPESSEDDDNPDITDFLGHYELRGAYKWRRHVFSVMSRNNLESGFDKGAIEASWSFPFWDWPYLKGYIQYFNGYGESMIDYNQKTHRIGIGISLTDIL